MINLRISFLFLLSCLVLFACQEGEQLTSKDFSDNCWEITDSLNFEIVYETIEAGEANDPVMIVNFLYDYPDRNIFVKTWITDPSGNTREEILEDVLFDQEGNWLKEEGTSDFVLKRPIPINPSEAGAYQVKLTQFTRRESLCDVKSVEIRY